MSFLDSVLSSLQTGKPSPLPPSQAAAVPAPPAVPKRDERKPSAVRPPAPPSGNVGGGLKRKAEDQLARPVKPETKVTSRPASTKPAATATKSPILSAQPRAISKPASTLTSRPAPAKPVSKIGTSMATKPAPAPAPKAPTKPTAATTPSKPPPKGSFAEIMAKAQALQDKAPTNAGTFRHQAVPKERLSKIERKRRAMEAQAKDKEPRSTKKPVPGATGKDKLAATKGSSEGPNYKGTAKPAKPSKQTPEPPSYRGTAGLPSSRGGGDRRHQSRSRSRGNEYLGTDEEDEGDYGGYAGYDDYYSDESSDMEAGLDDVDREEAAALKFARREDEEELRRETAAKNEKLARQQKLAALASRKR
ncbi:uncharacterized protein N7511_009273 [Penicillium nucicola]|uniref:uncharacterized protein n=1 Tax=Penicillium nucicola TaxID=1850975 RepID=UPI00254588AC|nr:uncharacterized protein N7511_009273 [Penicillium nucicola]KAJ5747577.1 hypothetical protein N7511_009273 [Penicillium nucicola]